MKHFGRGCWRRRNPRGSFRGVTTPFRLIGAGVYALPEAERMTGIPRKRIRRWLEGYHFTSSGRRHFMGPAVRSTLHRDVGELALTFSDLLEIRFLDAFLQHGLKWKDIRVAAERARDYLGRPHPFSSRLFKTDGRAILLEILRPGDDARLLNLVTDQWEFDRVVSPMLYAGIEFGDFDEPRRWWPMGRKRPVVIDPERSFGAPIVADEGVPTAILARSFVAEGTQRMVAAIYDVSIRSVRAAIAYENSLVA